MKQVTPTGRMDYAQVYEQMHREQPKKFAGYSIGVHVPKIAELVRKVGAARLLDYGSGKGYQYLVRRYHEQWGGVLPVCYDVGVPALRTRPEGLFGGVICTDVMEHIEEPDVDGVLADLFSFADTERSFVFLSICCVPAKKKLPNGQNVHLCIKPPAFWDQKIEPYRRPGIEVVVEFDEVER